MTILIQLWGWRGLERVFSVLGGQKGDNGRIHVITVKLSFSEGQMSPRHSDEELKSCRRPHQNHDALKCRIMVGSSTRGIVVVVASSWKISAIYVISTPCLGTLGSFLPFFSLLLFCFSRLEPRKLKWEEMRSHDLHLRNATGQPPISPPFRSVKPPWPLANHVTPRMIYDQYG